MFSNVQEVKHTEKKISCFFCECFFPVTFAFENTIKITREEKCDLSTLQLFHPQLSHFNGKVGKLWIGKVTKTFLLLHFPTSRGKKSQICTTDLLSRQSGKLYESVVESVLDFSRMYKGGKIIIVEVFATLPAYKSQTIKVGDRKIATTSHPCDFSTSKLEN